MSLHQPEDLARYLCPTAFIESQAAAIVSLARPLDQGDHTATAVVLFNWVRDEIAYDPSRVFDGPGEHRATAVLRAGSGYCVQKAVLLAALGRAVRIPTRLGFADVRNHQIPQSMARLMGTDLFVFHGYVEFFLEGRWVKATPAFDRETTRKAGALIVELDGKNDAMMHPVDPEGQPYIEYVRDRGHYADLPFEEIHQTFAAAYPTLAGRFRRGDG